MTGVSADALAAALERCTGPADADTLKQALAKLDLGSRSYRHALKLAKRAAKVPAGARDALGFPQLRVALLGEVTTDFLAPLLEAALLGRGIAAAVRAGAFGQVEELVFDPGSWLAEFKPDVVVVLGSTLALPDPKPERSRELLERRGQVGVAVAERFGADAVFTSLEPLPEHAAPGGVPEWLLGFNSELPRSLPSRAYVFDLLSLVAELGSDRWFDLRLWDLAGQSFDLNVAPQVADRLAGFLRALVEPPVKLIVTDLDGTLWGGLVAEVGADQVELQGDRGQGHARLQHFLRERVREGFLLAAVSKNTPDTARSPFLERSEMHLTLEDFVEFEASFLPKSLVLPEIVKRVNIGLDTVLFLDDQAHERAEMRERHPEVIVPEWPPDGVNGLPALLARSGLLSRPRLTAEDAQRTTSYRREKSRSHAEVAFPSLDEFLSSLDLVASFAPIGADNLDRVVQLVQKTNQFNVTTYRRTRRELEELLAVPGAYGRAVSVEDRYGPYGLTGVLVALPADEALAIDLWLMSCRIMAKTVEYAMFEHLRTFARRAGFSSIVGEFRPTEKNRAIAGLFDELRFTPLQSEPERRRYVFRVDARPGRENKHVQIVEAVGAQAA